MKKMEDKRSRDVTCKKMELCFWVSFLFKWIQFRQAGVKHCWSSFSGTFFFFPKYCNYLLSVCVFVCVCTLKTIQRILSVLQCPCRAEDDSLLSTSINLQVWRHLISDGGGNATLRNVIVFCGCQTITVKYLLFLFVWEGAGSYLGFKGKRADSVIKKSWSN